MKRFREYLSQLRFSRPALVESGKLVFALVGVGAVMANLAVCRFWQFGVSVVLFSAVWFAVYTQMEGVE